MTDAQFVLKVIDVGLRHIRTNEISLADGFALYLKSKQHLRPDSIRDIRCIGNRLLRTKPELGKRNFSELSVSECEEWLNAAFHTDSQFNKARRMLHGLFEFALRREWCDKNPIKRINRTPQSRRKGNPATETFRNKAANQNRSTRKPRICRCCRAFGLCGNSPEGSSQTHLARHRHRRKDNHSPLAMFQDGRCPPSGNSARLEQTFDSAFKRI